jgi:hypothetical protein
LADARCPAGYQSGARLFTGSPIPALSTTLPREVKKSILRLLYFNLMRDERFQNRLYSCEKAHPFFV